MTKIDQIYKCELCGNVVSVLEGHDAPMSCCGQNMTLLEEKTADQEGKEKHVPVITVEDNTVVVKVGSVEHPMEEAHYIEAIQLLRDGKVFVEKRLKPSDQPQATFCCLTNADGITTRALCNVHGLWTS